MTSSGSVMPLQTSGRKAVLDGLNEFIESSESKLLRVLTAVGWTRDSLEAGEMVTCPMDPGHLMPESSLARHITACQWAQDGYTKEEFMDTPSSSFFYQNKDTVFSLKIDPDKQTQILSSVNGGPTSKLVPRTPQRAASDMTQAEKVAVYDYVVGEARASRQSTLSARLLEEIGEDAEVSESSSKKAIKSESKALTRLEALKLMRDYKRRRQSYRAKNVHITKRSQTDIMREIIANQMEELESEQSESSAREEAQRCKRQGHLGTNDSTDPRPSEGMPRDGQRYKQNNTGPNQGPHRDSDSGGGSRTRGNSLQRDHREMDGTLDELSEGSKLSHHRPGAAVGDGENEDGLSRAGGSRESSQGGRTQGDGGGRGSESGADSCEEGPVKGGSREGRGRHGSPSRKRHRHKHAKKHSKKHREGRY